MHAAGWGEAELTQQRFYLELVSGPDQVQPLWVAESLAAIGLPKLSLKKCLAEKCAFEIVGLLRLTTAGLLVHTGRLNDWPAEGKLLCTSYKNPEDTILVPVVDAVVLRDPVAVVHGYVQPVAELGGVILSTSRGLWTLIASSRFSLAMLGQSVWTTGAVLAMLCHRGG